MRLSSSSGEKARSRSGVNGANAPSASASVFFVLMLLATSSVLPRCTAFQRHVRGRDADVLLGGGWVSMQFSVRFDIYFFLLFFVYLYMRMTKRWAKDCQPSERTHGCERK